MDLVGGLLERAARATPATTEVEEGGWWLRHTDSETWWSSVVIAHGAADDGRSLERIETAESFYSARASPARFQVCRACPPVLDQLLDDRGYDRVSSTSLQAREVEPPLDAAPGSALVVRVEPRPDEGWTAVRRTTGRAPSAVDDEARRLERRGLHSAYVTASNEDGPVAVGRAVVDDGWTGVFDMATALTARRKGGARVVLATIARWASDHDAPRLYLQVEQSNTAAHRLYATTGFTEVATYHYRVKDAAVAT